jgi:hypothetical protein
MKNEEEGLYSQHIQINKLGERSNLVKEETLKIDQSNVEHNDQLADMENELAEMSAMLGLDMENSDLSEVEGIVALTEKELQSIEKRIHIPPLEVIRFKDWNSFVEDSNAFLKNEGLDITSDPIFEMLSISEMSDVLQEYKDNYGEIFLDWKDYAVVLLAGATGALINQFAPDNLKKCKLISGEGEKQLLDESLNDWKDFAKEQISTQIGFDIDNLQNLKGLAIEKISSKIGFEPSKLKEIQEYLWEKKERGEGVTAIEDSLQIYQRLPTTWKMIADEWLTEKVGWTINEIILLQDFITKKIKSKKFKFSNDTIAIYQMLPQAWQEFGRDAILGRIGVELSDITNISNFIVEKIRSGKINPFYDLVELIKILPENWKVTLSSNISAKIGFDIAITENIQEYVSERIQKNDFDLMQDGVEILHRFPEEWQNLINRAISEKGGFDIALTTDMQKYIAQKIREKNFNLLIDGIELLRRLPEEWQVFICQLISAKIGFDITVLQNMQSHVLDRIDKGEFDFLEDGVELLKRLPEDWKDFLNRIISEKLGFDIRTTSEIQEFVLEKVQAQKFDLFEDGMELLGRFPMEWQEFLKSEISAKIGFDIMITLDIQTFLIRKIQERKFNLLEDSLELIQKLPEEWKDVINRKISEKAGLDPKLIGYCMNPNLAKLNRIRSKPFEFISQQIQTYIEDNKQLNVLNKYLDLNRLSEVIVLVLGILKVILADEPEENHDQLGEHFQELLIIIIDILNPSKEQLLQIGGEYVLDKTGSIAISAGTFEIDDWIANSGLNITIDELLEKLYSENDEEFRDEDLQNYAKLFSTIMEKSMENGVLSDTMEQMFSSTSVMRSFLHDRNSIRKLASFVDYARTGSEYPDESKFNFLANEIVIDVQKKLDILPKIMFQSGSQILSDPSALGNWLYENGLSINHLKKLGLTAAITEIMVRGWYLASLYNDTGTFKKEPYAVKVSTMLASAHMLSNLPALVQIAGGMPPTRLNVASLGLGAKYGLSAIAEYAKRETQIQKDLNDKLTSIYKHSLTLF